MLVVKLNLELVGDKGRSSDAHKTPQQMDFKHRPSGGRISSSMKLSDTSHEEVYHSYEEAYHSYEEAYKDDFEDHTTIRETGTDYKARLKNECSLKEGGMSFQRRYVDTMSG